jgi:hypothetical protein
MITPAALAVFVATALCLAVLAVVIRALTATRWLLPASATGKVSRWVTWTLAVATFPFVWFLGFVVGGNFGGAYASRLAEAWSISGEILIPLGIGFALFVCALVLSLLLALAGFVVTRYVEHARS